MSLLTPKNAMMAFRVARMFPAIPLAIGAMALIGCAKVASDIRKEQPLTQLAGSEWGLQGSDQFVAFKTKGELNGNGGCNNFFGSYTQEGNILTFGPLASTRKMCHGKMEAERRFMESLQKARRYEATHKVITFFDEDETLLMTLQRRDWD